VIVNFIDVLFVVDVKFHNFVEKFVNT